MIKSLIKKRLKNYKIQVSSINISLPKNTKNDKAIAVIGSGLAGISAAIVLAERGFKITIIEKNSYLGGKTGAWEHTFNDGYKTKIDHGFHAFFYQYYNLWNFIDKVKLRQNMNSIEEYMVMNLQKEKVSFKDVAKTPAFNILSLGRKGFYRFSEMLFNPQSIEMGIFLNYNEGKIFNKYDNESFADFSKRLQLTDGLQLVFNSFSRAFFAEPNQMSMAEMIKSFHFFYLSHDFGIDYDYFKGNYDDCFLKKIVEYFQDLDVKIKTQKTVNGIEKVDNKIYLDEEYYDYVVIATDVKGTKSIIDKSGWMKIEHPNYFSQLSGLNHSNGYAVLKIWIKGRFNQNLPAFFITDRMKALDSVTTFHTFDTDAKKWADENEGMVLELHCYSVTSELYNREIIKETLLNELFYYFPELKNREIKYEYLQLDNNFSSFQMNQHITRPDYKSPFNQIKFAGDWVKLPIPAMLMEAAFSSGLYAANEILAQENLQQEPIWSVPLNGLIHGNQN